MLTAAQLITGLKTSTTTKQKAMLKGLTLKAILLLTALMGAGFSAAAHADADLVLNHSDSPDPGPAGGTFTYTLRIDNNGPGLATGVTLANTLPPGSRFVSATTTAGTCTTPAVGSDGVVDCSLGDIPFTFPATSSQTVTIRVVLPTAGVWTNTATASTTAVDPNRGNDTNIVQPTTAQAAADMAVTATPSAATVIAGEPYNYAVVVTNNGPDGLPADGRYTINFTLPAGVTVRSVPTGTGWSCTPSSGYPLSSGNISCTHAGPLASSSTAPTLTVPAVMQVQGSSTVAFDVAAFKGNGDPMPDGNLNNNTATATVTSNTGSDVAITKTASPTTVEINTNVTYTLTPRHNGGMAPGSTGSGIITVVDTLGANLSFVSATGSGWTCTNAGQDVTCTRPGPYSGGNYSNMPTITVVATALAAGTLTNTAIISAPETDPVPSNNSASVNVTSTDQVDLQLTKTSSFNPVVVGQDFEYRLSVRNNGPLAARAGDTITVTDTIPAGVFLRAAPSTLGWVCTTSAPPPVAGPVDVTCSFTLGANLNSGTTMNVITLPVRQTTAGAIANQACVAFAGNGGRNDANAGNNCSTATVTATAAGSEADLVLVSKTASPTSVEAGENLTYVMTVRNDGPADATNVRLTDTLASLVGTGSLQSVTASQGTCTPAVPANGTSINLNCNLGTLTNGASATVTVVVRPSVATTGNRTNTASVFSDDIGDPNRTNNTNSVTSQVVAKVDVQVTKTANPASVPAGATITYVATVRNNGPSTASTVNMTDTLPANAAFIALSAATGGGTCSAPAAGTVGGTLNCTWASINSGTQQTVTYTLRPLTSAVGGTVVNNVAVSTATLETNMANNTATTTVAVTSPQLDILVQKDDTLDPIDLGTNTGYVITIDNAGPSYGTNLVMTDVFPDPTSSPTAVFSYQGGLNITVGGAALATPYPCTEPAIGATSGTLSCNFSGISSGSGGRVVVRYNMRAESITVAGAYSGTAFNKVNVRVDETESLMTNNEVVEATTTRRVSIATDLALTKSTTTPTVYAGVNIPYTLTVTNNGPLASDGAQVIDVLPAGVTFVSAPGCTHTSGTVACAVGALAVGASRSFTLTVQANTPYNGVDPLVNTADLDALGDTNPNNNRGTASTPANPAATPTDFALTKSTTVPTVYPGVTIPYTLTVTNNGPLDSPGGANVVDVLPAGVSFVSAPGCTEASGTVTCAVGTLAVGTSRSFTLTVQASNPYTGASPLMNQAEVQAIGDTNAANNRGTATTPVDPAATPTDFALTKSTTVPAVYPGVTIPYTLTVTNNGPLDSPGGANVVDVLPAGVSFVSAPGCTEASGTVTCAVGTLAVGASRSFTLTVRASNPYTGASPLVNQAEVQAIGDTNAANNRGTATTPYEPAATPTDFALTKTTTVSAVDPSGVIPYTLTVTNTGPLDSPGGANVVDVLPAGVTFVSAPGCAYAAGTVTCAVGALAVGATKSFVLTVKANSPYDGATPLANTARVEASGDTNPSNNTGTATSCVKTDLSISISTQSKVVIPGTDISWLITTTNNGPAVANNVVVTDELPRGVTFVSAPGCLLIADVVTCNLGSIGVGVSAPITLTVRVNAPYDGSSPLVNSARAAGDCVDIDPPNNIATSSLQTFGGGGGGGVKNIPTLSEWMMILLSLILLTSFYVSYRRRHK